MTTAVSGRSRWAPRSLSATIMVVLVALVGLGLLIAGIASTAALRGYLLNGIDAQLAAVNTPFDGRGGPIAIDGDEDNGRNSGRTPPSEFYVAFFDVAGAPIAVRSNPIDQRAGKPKLPTLTVDEVRDTRGRPFTVAGTRGDEWRVVARPFSDTRAVGNRGSDPPATLAGGTVLVAQSLASLQRTVSRLAMIQFAVGLAVLLLLAGIGYWLVRRSLGPLREVEVAADAVATGDLTRRIAFTDERTEVGRLGSSFNTMVARVQAAFGAQAASESAARESEERMRRFVADAGHELRTPLTTIRGFAELYRQGAVSDSAGTERAMSRIESEATRMGLLVDDLLTLSRVDARRPFDRAAIDLSTIAIDAAHDAEAGYPERNVRLDLPEGGGAVVVADDSAVRQVVSNLVSNAMRHTPEAATVTIRVRPDGQSGVLEVADDGPGMTQEHAVRAFERFYRVDESRTRGEGGGSGLGLSIVASLVAAQGGHVTLTTAPGQGATFSVVLPLWSASTAPVATLPEAAPQESEAGPR